MANYQAGNDASMEGEEVSREPYLVLDIDFDKLAERVVIFKVPDMDEGWKERPKVLSDTQEAAMAEAKFEVVSKLVCGATDSGLWTAQVKLPDVNVEADYVRATYAPPAPPVTECVSYRVCRDACPPRVVRITRGLTCEPPTARKPPGKQCPCAFRPRQRRTSGRTGGATPPPT